MDTQLISGANVEVTASTDRANHPVAKAIITGKDENGSDFRDEHRFPATSRISKHLEIMTPTQLSERLSGGTYFYVGGSLFDFRRGDYKGFIHTPGNIDALKNTIGIRSIESRYNQGNTQSSRHSLSKEWSQNEIVIPSFGEGGKFDSRLTFSWNPFVRTIRSSFDIVRLICENGMTGLTSLFSAKIPLENRWQEHLEIANVQIQNKLHSLIGQRFTNMGVERATIADCLLLQKHAQDRLESPLNLGQDTRNRIRNIVAAVSPEVQLAKYYKPAVFEDKRLGAQLPSHLTAFDAYNVATELSSHTSESEKSTTHSLDRFANVLVFDRADRKQHAARFGVDPNAAAFSDPEAAFFGNIATS